MPTKPMTLQEQLSFCTTRIEATDAQGNVSYGTGMFYQFTPAGLDPQFFIITNKHVALGQQQIQFSVSKADADGNPLFEAPLLLTIEGEELQRALNPHPDTDVDLCAIYIQPPLHELYINNVPRYFISINRENIPTPQDLKRLNGVEDILMVGYPNSLWDEHHHMPLVRRGITVTWPCLDYNGRKEFVIDCACYPGSSGSPVFICNEGSYTTRNSPLVVGSRIWLLGNLHAGPARGITGNIIVQTGIQQLPNAWAQSRDMLNLGFIIRSERILE